MALIGKIRKKSWLVVVIILAALVLFILSDKLFLGGGQPQKQFVGTVNGTDIEYVKFNQKFEQEVNQARAQKNGEQLQDYEIKQIRDRVWQQFVNENTILAEAKKLGLKVTEAELVDMVQGRNILEDLKKNFADPNTGEFSKDMVIKYLKSIDNPNEKDPNYQQLMNMKAMWQNFESSLPDYRLQEKYTELFTKSIYVTKAELEKNHNAANSKSVVSYVYIPYASIVDSTVKLSDDQLKQYFEANKYKFKVQEDLASIDYVEFPFRASKEDTAKAKSDIDNLVEKFATTTNDTSFVNTNSTGTNNISLVKPSELPYPLVSQVPNPEAGKVYGPFSDFASYKIYKLGALKEDDLYSIKASHILFKPNDTTAAGLADAKQRATDVLNRIKKGESFEMLAREFGTDGTKNQGGDLGVFQEKQMVPEFNDAVFKKGTPGLLSDLVKTQFGYHIIKITEPKVKYKKQVLYTIEKSIKPSSQTMDKVVNLSRTFKDQLKNSTIDELLKKPEFAGYTKMPNAQLQKASNYVGGLANAEAIVRWAYNPETDINDINDFRLSNSNVIAVLTKLRKKGDAKFEDVKEDVAPQAKNVAKGDMIVAKVKQLNTKTLEELANSYGAQATYKANDTITLASSLGNNFDQQAMGKVAALKVGKKSDAYKAENGVVIAEKLADIPAQPLADYTALKQGAKQNLMYKNMGGISNALNEVLKVEDNRYIFY
jgi:peptidyl-prolyl cis-trans isomerase D